MRRRWQIKMIGRRVYPDGTGMQRRGHHYVKYMEKFDA